MQSALKTRKEADYGLCLSTVSCEGVFLVHPLFEKSQIILSASERQHIQSQRDSPRGQTGPEHRTRKTIQKTRQQRDYAKRSHEPSKTVATTLRRNGTRKVKEEAILRVMREHHFPEKCLDFESDVRKHCCTRTILR